MILSPLKEKLFDDVTSSSFIDLRCLSILRQASEKSKNHPTYEYSDPRGIKSCGLV